MSLLHLPDELILLIVRNLDFESKLNLYKTCDRFARLVRAGYIGRVSLTQRIQQIVEKFSFYRLAPCIEHLDLSRAVSHVRNKWFVPAVQSLERLRSLNIATEKVMYPQRILMEMSTTCPDLVDLTIILPNHARTLAEELMPSLYRQVEHLHMIGEFSTIFNCDLIHKLQPCKALKELKVTGIQPIEHGFLIPDQEIHPPRNIAFKFFAAYMDDYSNLGYFDEEELDDYNNDINDLTLIKTLKIYKWDYIIVKNISGNVEIYTSPRFYRASVDMINSMLHNSEELRMNANNYHVFMWDPTFADCNQNFHANVINILNRHIPQQICKEKIHSGKLVGPSYLINPCIFRKYESVKLLQEDQENISPEKVRKIIRLVSDLSVDDIIPYGKCVRLTFATQCECTFEPVPLVLNPKSWILKELTYLSFTSGMDPWLSSKFLGELLQNCKRLNTLNCECNCRYVIDAIVQIDTLKNLRVFDDIGEHIFDLLRAMAQSPSSLENVHICDTQDESKHTRKAGSHIVELIEHSPNLYSLEYHGPWSKKAKVTQMQVIRPILMERDIRCKLVHFDSVEYYCSLSTNAFYRVFLPVSNLLDINFNVALK